MEHKLSHKRESQTDWSARTEAHVVDWLIGCVSRVKIFSINAANRPKKASPELIEVVSYQNQ